MKRIDTGCISPYYGDDEAMLFLGDTFESLQSLEPGSADMVFTDPQYFLSNGGITCHSGKMVSVHRRLRRTMSSTGAGSGSAKGS